MKMLQNKKERITKAKEQRLRELKSTLLFKSNNCNC
jgi:hypothetical protein